MKSEAVDGQAHRGQKRQPRFFALFWWWMRRDPVDEARVDFGFRPWKRGLKAVSGNGIAGSNRQEPNRTGVPRPFFCVAIGTSSGPSPKTLAETRRRDGSRGRPLGRRRCAFAEFLKRKAGRPRPWLPKLGGGERGPRPHFSRYWSFGGRLGCQNAPSCREAVFVGNLGRRATG